MALLKFFLPPLPSPRFCRGQCWLPLLLLLLFFSSSTQPSTLFVPASSAITTLQPHLISFLPYDTFSENHTIDKLLTPRCFCKSLRELVLRVIGRRVFLSPSVCTVQHFIRIHGNVFEKDFSDLYTSLAAMYSGSFNYTTVSAFIPCQVLQPMHLTSILLEFHNFVFIFPFPFLSLFISLTFLCLSLTISGRVSYSSFLCRAFKWPLLFHRGSWYVNGLKVGNLIRLWVYSWLLG